MMYFTLSFPIHKSRVTVRLLSSLLPGLNRQSGLILLHNTIFCLAVFGVVDVLLNFYFVSLGYQEETIGLLQSLPRIGGLFASLPFTLLASRLSIRRALIISAVLMTVSQGVMVFYPSVAVIIFSRAAFGFFFGVNQIAITPATADSADKNHQTHIFAYLSATTNISSSLGSFVGGYLPTWLVMLLPGLVVPSGTLPLAQTPWAYGVALLIATVVTALCVLPLLGIREVTPADESRSMGGVRARTPWGRLCLLSLPMLFFGLTGGLTFPFYNLFFRSVYDAPDATVGVVLSAGYLLMGVTPLIAPLIERRLGRVVGLMMALGLASVAFVGLSIAPNLWAAFICFAAAVSLRNMTQVIFPPMLMGSVSSQFQGAASSVGFLAWNVGWFASTAVGGSLQSHFGYDFMMQLVAVGVLAIAAAIWWMYRQTVSPVLGGAPFPIPPMDV